MIHSPWFCTLLLVTCSIATTTSHAQTASPMVIDSQTLNRKVMCGYQGWFFCPNDSTGHGWRHWSREGNRITPETLTFEMWPDMSEAQESEKYPAPGFVHQDGQPAYLFSSTNPQTVDRHFRWMQQHGIDGVFLQRFLVASHEKGVDQVLSNVRQSCRDTGRVMGLCYDLSGADPNTLYDKLVDDWKRLVDEKQITEDDRYLHHNNKPVLFIWGFYSDRFSPELANRIIDFFKNDPKYGVTLIGGCQWYWRTEKDPRWGEVFRRFDIISPWNVGNATVIDGVKHAATNSWQEDIEECRKTGMQFLPVIYPGFGWTNLKGAESSNANLPRLGGDFFWRQFHIASKLKVEMAYIAMFDEVDEGTAIFKVSNSPPTPGRFATYDGLPSDWYLRLTGEGTKLIRGERPNQREIPIEPRNE